MIKLRQINHSTLCVTRDTPDGNPQIKKQYSLALLILDAIDIKGFSFSRRVDKVRNEMRIQVGLGPLRSF